MKCIIKVWNRDNQRWDENEGVILHWGVTYEELNLGVGSYTVVYVKIENGEIKEVHPSNIRIVE